MNENNIFLKVKSLGDEILNLMEYTVILERIIYDLVLNCHTWQNIENMSGLEQYKCELILALKLKIKEKYNEIDKNKENIYKNINSLN